MSWHGPKSLPDWIAGHVGPSFPPPKRSNCAMKVLVVAPESPTPVTDGYGVHLEGLLLSLRADHEIHLVCYGDRCDIDGIEPVLVPRPDPPSSTRRYALAASGLADGVPAIVRRSANGGLRAKVREVAGRTSFDVGHLVTAEPGFACFDVDLPWVAGLVDAWGVAQRARARLAGPARRAALEITRTTAVRWERRLMRQVEVVCVGSAADRRALLPLSGGTRIEVVANGVDTDYLAPPASLSRKPDLVVFHGAMDFGPNVVGAEVLAREVLPRVRRRRPGARLRLVGRNPVASLRQLQTDAVEVTGAVEDLREALVDASVYACAIWHGSGVKNKVLEAASLGLPIVSTTEGVGSLSLQDGSSVLIRDDPDAMADAIADLLENRDRAELLGASARLRVVDEHSRKAVGRRYGQIYEQIRRPPSRQPRVMPIGGRPAR